MPLECYNYNSKLILYRYNLLHEPGHNKHNFPKQLKKDNNYIFVNTYILNFLVQAAMYVRVIFLGYKPSCKKLMKFDC